jgi:hypothetical protein
MFTNLSPLRNAQKIAKTKIPHTHWKNLSCLFIRFRGCPSRALRPLGAGPLRGSRLLSSSRLQTGKEAASGRSVRGRTPAPLPQHFFFDFTDPCFHSHPFLSGLTDSYIQKSCWVGPSVPLTRRDGKLAIISLALIATDILFHLIAHGLLHFAYRAKHL